MSDISCACSCWTSDISSDISETNIHTSVSWSRWDRLYQSVRSWYVAVICSSRRNKQNKLIGWSLYNIWLVNSEALLCDQMLRTICRSSRRRVLFPCPSDVQLSDDSLIPRTFISSRAKRYRLTVISTSSWCHAFVTTHLSQRLVHATHLHSVFWRQWSKLVYSTDHSVIDRYQKTSSWQWSDLLQQMQLMQHSNTMVITPSGHILNVSSKSPVS